MFKKKDIINLKIKKIKIDNFNKNISEEIQIDELAKTF
jgi:hypothetical protein